MDNFKLSNMKKILILITILVLVSCSKMQQSVNASTYYVSTSGNDANTGAIGSPWLSWGYAINRLVAGDILYIRAGTYTVMQGLGGGNYNGVRIAYKNGTAGSPITISVYPGDARPVLDCSGLTILQGYHRGILMDNCFWFNFYGLIIKNVREWSGEPTTYTGSAWEMQSCQNIKIEYCDVTYCMNGFSMSGLNTGISYINCDAHHNWDVYQGGDLCNGFNGNVNVASTISYTGCRAWKNCDDGFDDMGGGGFITYTNCWSFNNKPWHGGDEAGNGDGFKLGYSTKAAESGFQRTLYNCIAAYNGLMGFDESMDVGTTQNMQLYNCIAYYNNDYYSGFRFGVSAGTSATTLRNNIAIVPTSGSHTAYSGRARNTEDHNSWDGAVTANAADFVSVDTSQLRGTRQSDGSLPVITLFHLTSNSDLIGKGVAVGSNTKDAEGNSWSAPPSMGPYEFISKGGGGNETAPIVLTTIVTFIGSTTAVSGGTVTDDGGASITARGVCWGSSANPVAGGSHTTDGTGTGIFTSGITGLSKFSTYHVRAYATNSVGTSYGADIQFKTKGYKIVIY